MSPGPADLPGAGEPAGGSQASAAQPPPTGDRRRGAERRRSDRRSNERRSSESPWFGTIGFGHAEAEDTDPGTVGFSDAWPDTRTPPAEESRLGAQGSALARVYRAYAAARAVVGLVLVGTQAAGGLLGVRLLPAGTALCLGYALQAILFWLLPRFREDLLPPARRRSRRMQWMATIGVDLAVFTGLHLLEAGSSFNFAALLVLPVLMAGVLTRRLSALATAAAVTLMLLLSAWRGAQVGGDLNALMLQAGLAGLGLFVIALLSGELAGRLVREEASARGSLELARQQTQLSRLVIEEMVDGVLVVDQRLRVRAANPAARALLAEPGLAPPAPFPLDQRKAWENLSSAVGAALADPDTWPEAGRDIVLQFDHGRRRTLRVRARFMRRRDDLRDGPFGEPFCVLLLEDVRTAEARLRQEKLAAMGRVSAGIAHEIRNPLAAIAQANALLREDALGPTQARLATIVADNVERLKRIVDDVMEVAPAGAPPTQTVIDASAEVAATAAEWARTAEVPLGPDSRLQVELPRAPLGVVFDRDHLRRVLVNLLDNAHRHAAGGAGAIHLRLAERDDKTAELSVDSDSPPIAPEVERYLFEPFFSTRSRGTGLGLYICRELCERYRASIEYRSRPAGARPRNEFRVVMQRGELDLSTTTLGLVP